MNRREFLGTISAAAYFPHLAARRHRPTSGARLSSTCISIFAAQPAGNITHLDGAGVTKANLLTRARGRSIK